MQKKLENAKGNVCADGRE